MQLIRRLLPVAVAVGLVVPAVAAASLWIKPNGEGESVFTVKNGYIVASKGQKHIIAPSNFKCNLSNLAVQPKRIHVPGGKINFVGKAYPDAFRFPKVLGTLTWKGTLSGGTIRFRSPVSFKFTKSGIKTVKKPCDTGVLRYTKRPAGPFGGG